MFLPSCPHWLKNGGWVTTQQKTISTSKTVVEGRTQITNVSVDSYDASVGLSEKYGFDTAEEAQLWIQQEKKQLSRLPLAGFNSSGYFELCQATPPVHRGNQVYFYVPDKNVYLSKEDICPFTEAAVELLNRK